MLNNFIFQVHSRNKNGEPIEFKNYFELGWPPENPKQHYLASWLNCYVRSLNIMLKKNSTSARISGGIPESQPPLLYPPSSSPYDSHRPQQGLIHRVGVEGSGSFELFYWSTQLWTEFLLTPIVDRAHSRLKWFLRVFLEQSIISRFSF